MYGQVIAGIEKMELFYHDKELEYKRLAANDSLLSSNKEYYKFYETTYHHYAGCARAVKHILMENQKDLMRMFERHEKN